MEAHEGERGGWWHGCARGLALFVGGFSLLNILGELRVDGFDMNLWWIDLRPLPTRVGEGVLLAGSVLLLGWAMRPGCGEWWRRTGRWFAGLMLVVSVGNVASFYVLVARGRIVTGCPIPLSMLIALTMGWIAWGMGRRGGKRGSWAGMAMALGACVVLFPLAQMMCFGTTDYRRRAEAIVVLGAKAYSDGTPSAVLADRVQTACELYQAGYSTKLVFSGGPGDGAIDEPEAMRRMAMRLGVPDEAIELDGAGVNTAATAHNTVDLFNRLKVRRILVVSHFYHLPRIKMSYQRHGREVYTVPARMNYVPRALPQYMLREIAAIWVYYLRP